MSKVIFRDAEGRPIAGAAVAITSAPGETTDIGYITDDTGAIVLGAPASGSYGFVLSHSEGGQFQATADLDPGRDAEVTANPAG